MAKQTAGRDSLGEFAPQFAHLNDDVLFGEVWGREARALNPGGVVFIPAGVKHWHGAARDSWFSHVALEAPGEGCSTEWCAPVDGEAYDALP
ncbi:MAG: hypothetical protein HFF25_02925 [Oscillospiraceae bacterium]|jgi:hypothetical protein|nr:hypothetical protein [Oscillospiraceae bacterium]MCI9550486.1 hypothetical protein [Oscillospiraceae bacterium]